MAPPEKDVMGVRMHIDTDPPGDGEPPVPPPRKKQPSKPQVEVEMEPESETMEHRAKPVPRSHSPAGFKLEGPGGWRLTVPYALVLTLIAGGGGTAVGAKVFGDNKEADAAVRDELKLLRKEMAELAVDVRASRSAGVDNRNAFKKLANYTEQSVAPLVASLRECCSVKLEYEDEDAARDIEFHPAPASGSKAPRVQPKATIPAKPTL